MKNKFQKSSSENPDKQPNPFGLILLLVGVACVIGGVYLHFHGGMSTGYQTHKYSPGEVRGINGLGLIFFGAFFILVGAWLWTPHKK